VDNFWHNKHVQKGASFDLGCISVLRESLIRLNR
jgi:phosphoglucan,water dikinase